MQRINKLITFVILLVLLSSAALAQSPSTTKKAPNNQQAAIPAPSAVSGSGTVGQLVKWTGVQGSTTYTLGDSLIFEDKFGKVGIGTKTPTSPLTVQGMIETTLGGMKFPDGTVQTTAALSSIFHDTSLKGNGTAGSPLGVADNGVGNNQLANGAVTDNKIAAGQVVKSLNGLFDAVTLAEGSNIHITQTGNVITIDTTGPNVPVPLVLSGPVNQGGVISVTNTAQYGFGLIAIGSRRRTSPSQIIGGGILAQGGDNPAGSSDRAGAGLRAIGGFNHSLVGPLNGPGIEAHGGGCDSAPDCTPGKGIEVFAGVNPSGGRGLAGDFFGNIQVSGALNVTGTKNFKIDHPLDPENKYLFHAAIESSEVLNVYSGNITTDENGDAMVQLPAWFEAVNTDFRYQLTVIGSFNQAMVAGKIKNNAFAIKTNGPGVEVSWQVTGVRNDAVMKAHPFKAEEEKAESDRGYYLTPNAYGLPEEKGIEYLRNPELLRQMKEAREKAQKEKLQ